MRGPQERLRDILDAVAAIERYSVRGREAFDEDELIRSWMVHHLLVIGEAVMHLGPKFRAAHPILPWAQIIGMRNILVHEYFGVDPDEVWHMIERDVPELKRAIAKLLEEADSGP